MRKQYSISINVPLTFELDANGDIIPNQDDTEFNATEIVQGMYKLEGQNLDDYISRRRKLPYGLKLCEIDLDEPNSEFLLIQQNYDDPEVGYEG